MRPWYSMKKSDDDTAEVCIFDEIGVSFWGEDTVSAKAFNDELTSLGEVKNITLRVNSPGGDVFDGVAIHNMLKNHKATVTARVEGIAASAASYVVMAADKIVMPSNSFMLIHGASGLVWGKADDMRATAADLDRIDNSMTATYAARSAQTTDKIKAIMKEDRLMDAAEALYLGLTDEVTDPVKMAASYSLKLLPQSAAEKFKAALVTTAEPDPPPAKAVEGAEPRVPVAPPLPKSDNVVNLDAARKEGEAAHVKYVADVRDLCKLAGMEDKAITYVADNMPLEKVREALMAARADAGPNILPHHPLADKSLQAAAATSWGKITDKLNARIKK
jgi:ATP-dependent Clp endopeptidase proteolytic subunit ClpP